MSYKIFIRINLSIILTFLSHISYADMVEVGIQDAKRFFSQFTDFKHFDSRYGVNSFYSPSSIQIVKNEMYPNIVFKSIVVKTVSIKPSKGYAVEKLLFKCSPYQPKGNYVFQTTARLIYLNNGQVAPKNMQQLVVHAPENNINPNTTIDTYRKMLCS